MGRDTLTFEDDWDAWVFLKSRGYEMEKGVIKYREEKFGDMPEDEQRAINYLWLEWDWTYE